MIAIEKFRQGIAEAKTPLDIDRLDRTIDAMSAVALTQSVIVLEQSGLDITDLQSDY